MDAENEFFPIDEESYSPELAEAMEEYLAYRELEGVEVPTLTADQIPSEVKVALGIDIFPDEIVDTMLELSQKLVAYAAELTQGLEREGGSPFLTPVQAQRFAKCYTRSQATWKDFKRDLPQIRKTAGTVPRFGPKWVKPVLYTTAITGWAMGAQLGAGVGCYQAAKSRSPMRPAPRPRPMGRPMGP